MLIYFETYVYSSSPFLLLSLSHRLHFFIYSFLSFLLRFFLFLSFFFSLSFFHSPRHCPPFFPLLCILNRLIPHPNYLHFALLYFMFFLFLFNIFLFLCSFSSLLSFCFFLFYLALPLFPYLIQILFLLCRHYRKITRSLYG